MAEHPNVILVRQGLDCVAKGDEDGLVALWADDMTYYAVDEIGPPAEIRGRDEFLDMMRNGNQMVPARSYDIIDIRPAGSNLVVAHLRLKAVSARTGKCLSGDYLGVFRIKDGKLIEGWDFVSHETQQFLAETWG